MRIAVLVFGVLIVLEGILLLVKPQAFNKTAAFFARGRLMYIAALLKIAFGVFLLVAATSCDRKWIAIVIGLVYAGLGIMIFGMEKAKLQKRFEWWSQRSRIFVRILGILAAAIGGVMLYAAGMPK